MKIKNIKKIIFLALCFLYFGAINAQERYFDERYVYTQSHLKPVLINPGATGYNGGHEVLFNYNTRWSGFENSPRSFTVSYDGIVAQRLGFGALIMKDTYGPLEMTKGQASVSYGFKTTTNKIRVGLSGEYITHKLASTVIENIDPTDYKIIERLNGVDFFDISMGMYGEYEDKLTYGVVLPSLVSSKLSKTSADSTSRDFSYIINVGYKIDVATYDFKIIPSIYVKTLHGVPGHIDLNLIFKFLDEKLTGGVTYTVGGENRLGFLLGTSINKLDFYYSYNVSNNEFQHYNNGSHELTLGLRFSDMKETKVVE